MLPRPTLPALILAALATVTAQAQIIVAPPATRSEVKVLTSPIPDLTPAQIVLDYQDGESIRIGKVSGTQDLGHGWLLSGAAQVASGYSDRDFSAKGLSVAFGRRLEIGHACYLTLAGTVGILRGDATTADGQPDIDINQGALSVSISIPVGGTVLLEYTGGYIWNHYSAGSYDMATDRPTADSFTVGGAASSLGLRWKVGSQVDLKAGYCVYERGNYSREAWTVGVAVGF